MNKLKQLPKTTKEKIFWYEKKNEVRRTLRANEIHEAYRGGRVEAFQTGNYQNVTYIDCNSLYPYSLINMPYPELKTERLHKTPTKTQFTQLIKKIGITKCMITNTDNQIGIIPIRTKTSAYYIKPGQTAIGTWTHTELQCAKNNGHKINEIEWTITYEQMENPFTKIIQETYKKRLTSQGS